MSATTDILDTLTKSCSGWGEEEHLALDRLYAAARPAPKKLKGTVTVEYAWGKDGWFWLPEHHAAGADFWMNANSQQSGAGFTTSKLIHASPVRVRVEKTLNDPEVKAYLAEMQTRNP
jgi:hypothetical protein